MDAAERRIREAGYDGFSFRQIATDVGVKSASVHYHFPTKKMLVIAVARRYRERFLTVIEREHAAGSSVVDVWRNAFRRSLREDGRACLCGTLGITANGLAVGVAMEVRHFFEAGIEQMIANGLKREEAEHVLALLEGAMLTSIAMGDVILFDRATKSLEPMRARQCT